MQIRKIIGTVGKIAAAIIIVVDLGLLLLISSVFFFVAIFTPELVLELEYEVSSLQILAYGLFSFSIFIICLAIISAALLNLSMKQFFGLLAHKALDWRTVRNPLTDSWYPELYQK